MTTSNLKMGVQTTPETSLLLNRTQTMENVRYNTAMNQP